MAASQLSAPASASGSAPTSGRGTPATAADSTLRAPLKDGNTSGGSQQNAADMPVRTKESFDKLMIERFTMRDSTAAATLGHQLNQTKASTQEMREKIHEYRTIRADYRQPWFTPSRLYGEGYNGFGNGYTENPQGSRIIYPSQKPRPGRRDAPQIKYKRKDMLKQADQHEELVPVRLEVEWDKIRLRDTFTWNLHERIIGAEAFALHLCEDLGLKLPTCRPVYDQIVQQMKDQLNDFYPFAYSDEDALDPELPYSAYKNDEMRVLIKLNITIGQHTLVDQFEWELNNPSNSPEEFAESMSNDLSLSGEFTTAIAHCIREQTQLFTRSLYGIGHPFDGRPVEDPDLVTAFLQTPLPTVFRPQQQAKDFAPYLYELSDADLERNELVLSREQRRQKRSINRRGGPQLPDLRERQRTIRTLIMSSVLPGAALDAEETRLYKRAGGTGRKRVGRDGEISDSEDSEDSGPDSPAQSHLNQGTARTRGMRGAASMAQQRMANLGRSETPEANSILHHHETRTSRRFREETEEPLHLWVTLRLGREKLRRAMKGDYRDIQVAPAMHTSSPSINSRSISANNIPRSMPPPTSQPMPSALVASNSLPPGQIGRQPAPPIAPGQSPPPAVSFIIPPRIFEMR